MPLRRSRAPAPAVSSFSLPRFLFVDYRASERGKSYGAERVPGSVLFLLVCAALPQVERVDPLSSHFFQSPLTPPPRPFSDDGIFSPQDLLLASLDAARWDLAGSAKKGRHRLREAAQIANGLREELSEVQGEGGIMCPPVSRFLDLVALVCFDVREPG